jgi:hypothetical protein
MPAFKDVTGEVFGRLTVIRCTGERNSSGLIWECRCSCSAKVFTQVSKLRSGNTQSCGCLRLERVRVAMSKTFTKHGASRSAEKTHPLYRIWTNMKSRCYNVNNKRFARYGGRGILVCKEWRNDYTAFRDYMISLINCPKNAQISGAKIDLQIDRYPNNDGNYEPGNVRWATQEEQALNTSKNRLIPINGKRIPFSQAVRKYGKAKESTIRMRIDVYGWTTRDAFLTPERVKP